MTILNATTHMIRHSKSTKPSKERHRTPRDVCLATREYTAHQQDSAVDGLCLPHGLGITDNSLSIKDIMASDEPAPNNCRM